MLQLTVTLTDWDPFTPWWLWQTPLDMLYSFCWFAPFHYHNDTSNCNQSLFYLQKCTAENLDCCQTVIEWYPVNSLRTKLFTHATKASLETLPPPRASVSLMGNGLHQSYAKVSNSSSLVYLFVASEDKILFKCKQMRDVYYSQAQCTNQDL